MLKSRYTNDTVVECGIDEAGRGSLWGPLYASAVIWKDESLWDDELRKLSEKIKDSKKISAKKRELLYDAICKHSVSYGIGLVSAQEIDTWGMTKANRTAFERALSNLSVEPKRILIDGCLSINSDKEQIVEPALDNTYICVAAASIIAKVAHDKYIIDYIDKHTELNTKYDLINNKGYGTLKHRNGILKYGKHELHRDLFLRKLLGSNIKQDTTCLILDD